MMSSIVKNGLIIFLLLAVGLLLFKGCEDNRKFEQTKKVLIDDAQVYAAELVDEKERVYQLEQKQVESSKYVDALLDTIQNLKNIKSSTRIITETEIKEVEVPYEVEVLVYITQEGLDYIKVPMPFNKRTKWYSLTGIVQKDNILFNEITYSNDFTIVAGEEDHSSFFKNLFKPNKSVIQVRDNNPYSYVVEGNSVVINAPKNRFHVGPSIGYGFTEQGDTFFIGITGTYSLISF